MEKKEKEYLLNLLFQREKNLMNRLCKLEDNNSKNEYLLSELRTEFLGLNYYTIEKSKIFLQNDMSGVNCGLSKKELK